MRKLVVGLAVAAVFAFISYSSFADCGKCVNSTTKCGMQSSQTGCNTQCRKAPCGADKPCCDKCAKTGNKACSPKNCCCKSTDGKPCCDKCAKTGCCNKNADCAKGCNCCCAGNAAAKTTSAAPADKEFLTDPVCGMDVDTASSKITYEYKGKTYHFCSESCKNRFVKDPSKFIGD